MKQEDVWRGIDRLADELGVTPSRLAQMSGLDAALLSQARRHRPDGTLRWPTLETLSRVLNSFDLTLDEFAGHMFGDPTSKAGFMLPCLNLIAATDDAHFDKENLPIRGRWMMVEFPDLRDPNCFGLLVDTDRYEPIYRENDLLVCAPGQQIRRGDRIAFKAEDGYVRLAELSKQSTFTTDLTDLVTEETETMPTASLIWTARIAWVRQ